MMTKFATTMLFICVLASTPADAADPCAGKQNGRLCSDSNACTKGDACLNQRCVGAPINLKLFDDNNICTKTTCNTVTGAITQVAIIGAVCNDGNSCTTKDACNAYAQCKGTPFNPATNEDGNACTKAQCNPETGAIKQLLDVKATCSDQNICTGNDGCHEQNGIIACGGQPINFDDGNACTTDSCDAVKGPSHAPLVCSNGATCQAGTCVKPVASCDSVQKDDGDACTADSCDKGVVSYIVDVACKAKQQPSNFQLCANGSTPEVKSMGQDEPNNPLSLGNLKSNFYLDPVKLYWGTFSNTETFMASSLPASGGVGVNYGTYRYQHIAGGDPLSDTWLEGFSLKDKPKLVTPHQNALYALGASTFLRITDQAVPLTNPVISDPYGGPILLTSVGNQLVIGAEKKVSTAPPQYTVYSSKDNGNQWATWSLPPAEGTAKLFAFEQAPGIPMILRIQSGTTQAFTLDPNANGGAATPVPLGPAPFPMLDPTYASASIEQFANLPGSSANGTTTPPQLLLRVRTADWTKIESTLLSLDVGQTWVTIPDPAVGEIWQEVFGTEVGGIPQNVEVSRYSLTPYFTTMNGQFIASFGTHLFQLDLAQSAWKSLGEAAVPTTFSDEQFQKSYLLGAEPCEVNIQNVHGTLLLYAPRKGCTLSKASYSKLIKLNSPFNYNGPGFMQKFSGIYQLQCSASAGLEKPTSTFETSGTAVPPGAGAK